MAIVIKAEFRSFPLSYHQIKLSAYYRNTPKTKFLGYSKRILDLIKERFVEIKSGNNISSFKVIVFLTFNSLIVKIQL